MAKQDKPDPEPGTEQSSSFLFKVAFEGQPEKPINVTAYVFDAQGALLASAPVSEGQAQLALTDDQVKSAHIFFAAPPEGRKEVTLATMARLHAYEPAWRFDPQQRVIELLPIPEYCWQWWYWCLCRVRGQVVKPVTIGGIIYNKPVCNARVHICEVDLLFWIILRLPDDIIFRLRDELLEAVIRPWPFPEPDPPPFRFDPSVIDPSPINVANMLKARLEVKGFNPQPDPPGMPIRTAAMRASGDESLLKELPLATRATLMSSSLAVVKQALVDNLALIRPWICWWPWIWPYFCDCEEIAVVTTDHQGRFDTSIWYPCFGDHPDLHFSIEYRIGGAWTTVYDLPTCCSTYWDYVCGSEVTLPVTDPRVPWCGDEPSLKGLQVAVLSIGYYVSMTEIQRSSAGANEGLTNDALPAPFGGSLEPHVWFGDSLVPPSDGAPSPSGITHYRWSYRRLGSTSEGDWSAMDQEVVRHYGEIMADSTLVFKPYPLGPDPTFAGQNLFKIRPATPPLNAGAVSSSWAPEVNARANTASAYFRSWLLNGGNAEVAAGNYELKLELFNGGIRVNLSDAGVLLKVPTVVAPFDATVPTELVGNFPALLGDMEDRVLRDGTGRIVAFRLVLHVDNNRCEAAINDVTVNSDAAGECGFISYKPGSDAVISFIARHPHDFATFDFQVNKGSCGTVGEASANGSVAGPVNGFARSPASVFTKSVAVTDLLNGGTCGTMCIKAAFAETLHVDALATDGWSTLDYLDANAVTKAFALEPK